MKDEVKREMEKIKIPDELHTRTKMGIRQVKREEKRWKKYPKWMIGTVASLMIIVVSFSIGSSYIADAAGTLLGKILGTEEQEQFQRDTQKYAPDSEGGAIEVKAAFQQMEQHLNLAKEHLSLAEFENYSQLIKESLKINIESLNPKADQEKLDQQAIELREEIQKYGIYALTIHTLDEAQAMVNYPINYPAYIPEGYELIEEEARTQETHVGENPVVDFKYRQINGEFDFHTTTKKIDPTKKDELLYDHVNSYELNGYAFEHGYSDSNVQGMRIMIPEKGYEIKIDASLLSKEEMEKVLLSMVEQ